jgi:hypothetical protein
LGFGVLDLGFFWDLKIGIWILLASLREIASLSYLSFVIWCLVFGFFWDLKIGIWILFEFCDLVFGIWFFFGI